MGSCTAWQVQLILDPSAEDRAPEEVAEAGSGLAPGGALGVAACILDQSAIVSSSNNSNNIM